MFGQECNTDAADADGNVWSVESVDGWDAPDQRQQELAPTGQHGSNLTGIYAEGRRIVITGAVEASSQSGAWVAHSRITAALPGLLGSGDVLVFEPGTTKSLTVKRSGKPRITDPVMHYLAFSLTLLAEYPWKRSLTSVTVAVAAGATVPFTATGSFPAEVQVTTTSAGTVDLTGPGGLRLRTGSLPSGAVLTSGFGFTNPKRTIRDAGGASLFGLIVQPMQWPCVVPGSNSFVNAGTAALSLTYFPTYA